MISNNNKTLPIPTTFRIQECEFEHNFGCWGNLFTAKFQNNNNEVVSRTCCEAHQANPRLTQGKNIDFGTKVTEWEQITFAENRYKDSFKSPFDKNQKEKSYSVNLLPMSVIHAAFKSLYGRKPIEGDLNSLKVDMQGEYLVLTVPESVDLRKLQSKKK